jgi:hypothetical protein
MSAYIRPQSAGEILRNAMHLYRTNFREFFLVYLVPTLPVSVVYVIALDIGSPKLSYAAAALALLAGAFAVMPITVVLSDICLGNEPSVRRAFRRAFDRSFGQLIGTFLLYMVIITLGLILCVIPGLVFYGWYLFALTIVVLERTGGWAALRRSKELGQGCYLRNLGIFFLVNLIIIIGSSLTGGIFFAASEFAGLHLTVAKIAANTINMFLAPIVVITTVLMYYDMRARKEAYDNAALAEDLRR